ncbi:MAG: hypothetical protein J1F12_08970 [Muribaculaceae bacterium]|nr:hypothetical protein [Muribaculaceae bacterium]
MNYTFENKNIHIRHFNFYYLSIFIFLLIYVYLVFLFPSVIIPFIFLGFLLLILLYLIRKQKFENRKETILLYLFTSGFYGLLIVISHLIFIQNPETDYFFAKDTLTFFKVGQHLGNKDITDIYKYDLSIFNYTDFYFYAIISGIIYKIGLIFHCNDYHFLLVLFNALLGGLTISLTFKCACVERENKFSSFIWFILFSPILLNSTILLRDIFITLIYTWIYLYVITDHCRNRLFKIGLLVIFSFFLRPENGLFALSFIFLWLWSKRDQFSKKAKFAIYIGIFIILMLLIPYVLNVTTNTLSAYNERDLSIASEDSMGAMVKRLPIPINYIGAFMFLQIMPFPFYQFLLTENGGIITILTIISPFYWIYLLAVTFISLWINKAKILKFNNLSFWTLLLCLLYVVLIANGETNVRRAMPVYPIIFTIYLIYKNYLSQNFKFNIARSSVIAMLFLNLVYLSIKFI